MCLDWMNCPEVLMFERNAFGLNELLHSSKVWIEFEFKWFGFSRIVKKVVQFEFQFVWIELSHSSKVWIEFEFKWFGFSRIVKKLYSLNWNSFGSNWIVPKF